MLKDLRCSFPNLHRAWLTHDQVFNTLLQMDTIYAVLGGNHHVE